MLFSGNIHAINLAAHLLNDAWKELFEVAVVISNDTDLVTPIRMVTTERKKHGLVQACNYSLAKSVSTLCKTASTISVGKGHINAAFLACQSMLLT